MNSNILEAKFARIGARVKQSNGAFGHAWAANGLVSLDVRSDRNVEYFEVIDRGSSPTEIEVLDVRTDDRHLLLMVREHGQKHKYLCGRQRCETWPSSTDLSQIDGERQPRTLFPIVRRPDIACFATAGGSSACPPGDRSARFALVHCQFSPKNRTGR